MMKNIKMIILDVDGTLTDGKIYIDNSGIESKTFNVKDGMAISLAIKNDIVVGIVTGRESAIVDIRSKELGIKEVHQGIHNKVDKVSEISVKYGFGMHEICYVGDDINDLKVMKMVGYSACPENAANEIFDIVDYISIYKGGDGAVRDIIEVILKEMKIWDFAVNNYSGGRQ